MTWGIQFCLLYALLTLMLAWPHLSSAQALEPRRWTHLPVGAQFIGVSYVYTQSDILLDPVLEIENAEMDMNTIGLSYIRSINLFDQSARLDFSLPYKTGRWEGLLDGQVAKARRDGFADPSLRLSVLLYGAPALSGNEFAEYSSTHTANTIVGAGLSFVMPLGEYDRDRLINLGSNRFVLRPELGFVYQRAKWDLELTGSVALFSDNDEFFDGDSTREQDPLFLLQGHIIHTFRPGIWMSLSGGYDFGGETAVNGVVRDDRQENYYWAISSGFPFGKTQGVKIAWVGGRTNLRIGSDDNYLVVAWSVMF